MGNVKMQKVDLCVIQDNELAQVIFKNRKETRSSNRSCS